LLSKIVQQQYQNSQRSTPWETTPVRVFLNLVSYENSLV
jgi:hypothetical protein